MLSRAAVPARPATRALRVAARAQPVRARAGGALPAQAWRRPSALSLRRRPLRSQPEDAAEGVAAEAEAAVAPAAEAAAAALEVAAAPAEPELAPPAPEAPAAEAAPAPAPARAPAVDAEDEMAVAEAEWTSDGDWAVAHGYSRDGMVRQRGACARARAFVG
jgi:2-oxoglutarate dehydrogenase E2 component (dihydrolipoamide succinyltransferase)